MGASLSRVLLRRAASTDDFEQVLAQLDDRLHRAELNIAEWVLRQRKLLAVLTTYSVLVYSLWLLSFFFVTWPRVSVAEDGLVGVLVKCVPVIGGPVVIAMVRWLVIAYGRRYVALQETELDSLRKKQRLTIEEMKQRMKYYQAKNIIERYEGATASPNANAPAIGTATRDGASPRVVGKPPLAQFGQQRTPGQQHQQFQQLQQPSVMNGNSPGAASIASPGSATGTPRAKTKGLAMGNIHASGASQHNISSSPASRPNTLSPLHLQQQRQQPYGNTASAERTWVDRVLDLIVGEDTPASKYALICERCFTHNGIECGGLCQPDEYDHVQYTCPQCGHFNSKRKRLFQNVSSPPGTPMALVGASPSVFGGVAASVNTGTVPETGNEEQLRAATRPPPNDSPTPPTRRRDMDSDSVTPIEVDSANAKDDEDRSADVDDAASVTSTTSASAATSTALDRTLTKASERRGKKKDKKGKTTSGS